MYVTFDHDRRGTDNVQRVRIAFDNGATIVVSVNENGDETLAIKGASDTMTRAGSLSEWRDAATISHGTLAIRYARLRNT